MTYEDGLVILPSINWMKQSVDENISGLIIPNDNELQIQFASLLSSDSGNYTCRSEISIESIDLSLASSNDFSIKFTCMYDNIT